MTKSELLKLLEMANSGNIDDHALVIELLNNDLDGLSPEIIRGFALLCSTVDYMTGTGAYYSKFIDLWSSHISLVNMYPNPVEPHLKLLIEQL